MTGIHSNYPRNNCSANINVNVCKYVFRKTKVIFRGFALGGRGRGKREKLINL